MTFFSAVALLFLVLDPIGNVPLFLCALRRVPKKRRKYVLVREQLIGLTILVGFLFLGRLILQALQISECSLGMAGGIVLFMISIRMVFGSSGDMFGKDEDDREPFIVPLAVPFIAGPSALTTVILFMSREPARWLEWLGALLCAWLLSSMILFGSRRLLRIFGDRGIAAMERLAGMLLAAVSVELFVQGVKQVFFTTGQ